MRREYGTGQRGPCRLNIRCVMDPHLHAAAVALSAGNPLRALGYVALRDDATALALRGVALAQLGDYERAAALLKRALRAFGSDAVLERARCMTALAELSLVARDLQIPLTSLQDAITTFDAHGDRRNALHARVLFARGSMLTGELANAERVLLDANLRRAPARLVAATELMRAELALRRMDLPRARRALSRARGPAERAAIPALSFELERLEGALTAPAARLFSRGHVQALRLLDVEALFAERAWVVDACRRMLHFRTRQLSFARKPVLFALLRCLAEAWPEPVSREQLISAGFGVNKPNASHRARLRVELGRLRKLLATTAEVQAHSVGYRIVVTQASRVVVLVPPFDGDAAALLALLSDGASWSTSSLALALGSSQRTVQRALLELKESGSVHSTGRGRARRWSATPLTTLGPQIYGLFAFGTAMR